VLILQAITSATDKHGLDSHSAVRAYGNLVNKDKAKKEKMCGFAS